MIDDEFDEVLSPLRETEPPVEVQAANRAAVQAALATHEPLRLWQRSVAVPMPVALVTAALLLVSALFNLASGMRDRSGSRQGTTINGPAEATPGVAGIASSRIAYAETQRYVSGLGVIDRQVSYGITE